MTSAGRAFQTRAPATEKARRPTVGSLTAGMHRSSEVEDPSLLSPPVPSFSLIFPRLPSLPLEVGPFIAAKGPGELFSSPSGAQTPNGIS